MQKVINYLYLIYMFGVYPVITHNKYFDITITRYHAFLYGACAFIFLTAISAIVKLSMGEKLTPRFAWKKNPIGEPELWVLLFLLANFVSAIVTDDPREAMFGEQSRHMGVLIYFVFAVMILVMSGGFEVAEEIFLVFAASSAYAYIVAIFQHMEIDFMHYKDNIKKDLYNKFISTFGNINMFAGFLCVSIPIFLAMFIFSKKLYMRITAGVLITMGGMVIMISNSDSVYVGLAVATVVLLVLAIKEGYVGHFMFGYSFLALGNLFLTLINTYAHTRYDKKRGGLALALNRIDVAVLFVVFMALATVVVYLLRKVYGDKIAKINKKAIIIAVIVCAALFGIAFFIYGAFIRGSSLFKLNYKWGSYRGYIWTKMVELFRDASPINKIFGHGNESVRTLMNTYYYTEMISVTHMAYDNAHCELLQYLICNGIFGLVAYVGMIVTSIAYIWKNANGKPVAYMSLVAIIGYLGQSLLSLNQPISTPFLFLFIGLGLGYATIQKKAIETEAK